MSEYKNIDKILIEVDYSEDEKEWVEALINSDLDHSRIWNGEVNSIGVRRTDRDSIIKKIKRELEEIQGGYCYYCGFRFGYRVGELGIKNVHREHIAPKSVYKEFTFTAKNLVLACSICNGDDYKGDSDTIGRHDPVYENCEFNIIHPYLDSKRDHLKLENDGSLSNVNDSIKGQNTRDMFGLDETYHIENRRLYIIFEKYDIASVGDLEALLEINRTR